MTKRLNLLLHSSPAKSLEWLVKNTDTMTQTAAVERSLLLYQKIAELEQQGFELVMTNAQGDVVKLVMLFS